MEILHTRISQIQEDLGISAGTDPLYDKYRSGAIGAYSDILNISVEDMSND